MRLFIAINFSERIKDALCETIADLMTASRRGRFTRRDNLHLTLAFIGETDRVDDIIDVMDEARDDISESKVRITLSGAGAFTRKGGDIHWIGVEHTPELKRLAQCIASGLRDGGFDIEKRKFTPHVTIGREVRLHADARITAPMASMDVKSISLMRSDRSQGELVYTELASVPLRG
jgi:2'-5' RNA ligase